MTCVTHSVARQQNKTRDFWRCMELIFHKIAAFLGSLIFLIVLSQTTALGIMLQVLDVYADKIKRSAFISESDSKRTH